MRVDRAGSLHVKVYRRASQSRLVCEDLAMDDRIWILTQERIQTTLGGLRDSVFELDLWKLIER